jgi:hypothetical protein
MIAPFEEDGDVFETLGVGILYEKYLSATLVAGAS